MHLERKIALRMSHAETHTLCMNTHSNYWPRLIIKENNTSKWHHLPQYGDPRAKEKFTICTMEGLVEHEFKYKDGECSPPTKSKGQAAGWQAGGQYVTL